jgi:hypothetical protein
MKLNVVVGIAIAVVIVAGVGGVLLLRTPAGPSENQPGGDQGENQQPENQPLGGQLTSDFTPPQGKATGPAGDGPWSYRLLSATSTDGLTFTRTNNVITDQADVPDLVQDNNGWIYLYYVGWTVGDETNKTVVAISQDGGSTWIYKKLHLTGFDDMTEPVDPDVQILPNGTFRLYLTSAQSSGAKTSIYYAEGTDGINFTNKGVAFSRTGKSLIDPTTALIGSTWHIFTRGDVDTTDANSHGTSSDGTNFTFDEEKVFTIDGEERTMGNGIAVPDGCRFYAHAGSPAITSFFTTDGVTWTADTDACLTLDETTGQETQIIKEPAVVRLENENYFMVYAVGIP